jgi:hypothetical protein
MLRTSRVLALLLLPVAAVGCNDPSSTTAAPSASSTESVSAAAPKAVVEPTVDRSLEVDPPAPVVQPEPVARQATIQTTRPPAPQYVTVDVPAGTELEVELIDALSSGTSQVGDVVRARLSSALRADGTLIAPAGAELTGTVIDVVPLDKFGGQPSLTFVFDELAADDGRRVAILASHTQAGKKQAARDAAKIGGGAAAGAVLGHQFDGKKGKEIGALIGGAIGTAVAAKTGKEVELAPGAQLVVALDVDVEVRVES